MENKKDILAQKYLQDNERFADMFKFSEIISLDDAYRHMDNETMMVIREFAGVKVRLDDKKGEIDMGYAWDDHYQDGVKAGEKIGEARGEKRGEKRGKKQGQINILKRIMDQMNLSAE